MEGKARSMSQKDELAYILGELIPQFEEKLKAWNKEYTQERDLGVASSGMGRMAPNGARTPERSSSR
jgi:hypothetical protein